MSKILKKIGKITLPTKFGDFQMLVFENIGTGKFAAALIIGKVESKEGVLLRVHSSCLTGDVFGSLLCDCGVQLKQSLKMMVEVDCGVLIYLDQEGRGIGLGNKIKAMELQEQGLDTVDANLALGLPVDARTFEEAAEIIKALGIKSVELLTNNPQKINDLTSFGIRVCQRVMCFEKPDPVMGKYLKTKKERMGHLLPI